MDRYLERVAFVTLASGKWTDFAYVDGYSGPWQARGEKSEDTSVSIALTKLKDVGQALQEVGRQTRTTALFIERDPKAFERLQALLATFPESNAKSIKGEFQDHIDDVVQFNGKAFSLTFIDPTGWNIDLLALRPLLEGRGEVLINFMYDFVNRMVENPDPNIQAQLTRTFGGDGWKQEIDQLIAASFPREIAILEVFMRRLQQIGKYEHVTYTSILKPSADRTYFHLVYGTRHWKGLEEFRKAEAGAMEIQERVRFDIKQDVRTQRTGMNDMFAQSDEDGSAHQLRDRQQINRGRALAEVKSFMSKRKRVIAHETWAVAMAIPLVTLRDANAILMKLAKAGYIHVQLEGRQRVPDAETVITTVE